MPPVKLLEEGYYLANFERVLSFVLAHHAWLLRPHEAQRVKDFFGLSLAARRLYVRLYTRRGPFFRASMLSYPEIQPLASALVTLCEAGFAACLTRPVDDHEATVLFDLFPREVIAPIAKKLVKRAPTPYPPPEKSAPQKASTKEELLAALIAHPAVWSSLPSERFITLLDQELFSLFELLFFGNRHQSLTEFVLVDIEQTRYPRYPLTHQPPLFTGRVAVERYRAAGVALDAIAHADPALAATLLVSAWEALAQWRPLLPHQRQVDPGRYWARVAFLAARQLERAGQLDEARAAFLRLSTVAADPHVQAEAAERLGILCQRQQDLAPFDACSVALLSQPIDALSRFQLEARRARLTLGPDPKDSLLLAPTISLSLKHIGHEGSKATYQDPALRQGAETTGEPLTIELATLAALGGDGLFAENFLFLTLFGLLFWEVIFAPLPGVFVQPFQAGPLDLLSDEFYDRRRDPFTARFAALTEADLDAEIARAFSAHQGEACAFVSWGVYDLAQLTRVARAFGAKLWGVLARIARYPNRHSNGLPDLLVFHGDEVMLVEVKGPGDSIRLAQRLWHDHLLRLGVVVKVAKVTRV